VANNVKKIYISADIEGITGVVSWNETEQGKPDYAYFRKIMAEEVNAAIEAAIKAGVKEVLVRDAHGDALNILPSDLHKKARLVRSWSSGPLCMMEGIDQGFDAVLFIGYHAKAGTPHAPLKHTYSGVIYDLRVNGVTLSEAGWNALIAGYYNVPVIFASGDGALCGQVNKILPNVVTVAVKKGIGNACISVHPEVARTRIRQGVTKALSKIDSMKPYCMEPPYRLELFFKDETQAWKSHWYPGAELTSETTVALENDDFFEILRFFNFIM